MEELLLYDEQRVLHKSENTDDTHTNTEQCAVVFCWKPLITKYKIHF